MSSKKEKKDVKTTKKEQNNDNKKLPLIELLCVIVEKNKGQKAIDILNALNVDLQVLSSARGTADSTLADYFSIDAGEKDMIFALIKIKHKSKILALLNENLGFEKKNSGLAFTIPIKSAMYSVLNQMGFELN